MKSTDIIFEKPLVEGIIQKRKSQFTMLVNVKEDICNCHCPTTGRIGNLDVSGLPCLLSKSNDPNRKTAYTVEAVSLNHHDDKDKVWIGINQNAINRYVKHFLANGGFADMVGTGNIIYREQILGISKLDFLVGNTYLEVKTPLQHLQIEYPDYIKTNKATSFNSTDRFVKHVAELANSLKDHKRAILLVCFIYDNPGFQVIERSTNYVQVKATIDKSMEMGVEIWQANFNIIPNSITLKKYFKLSL